MQYEYRKVGIYVCVVPPVVQCSPVAACAAAAQCPRMAGAAHPLVRARHFPAHVAALHADGDIGFR